jgi:vancomycin resistance protein YoaR
VQAYLSNVTASDRVAPVEPGVVWDASGKPVDLTAGKDGLGVDAAGTTSEVSAYLDALASGGSIGPSVEAVTAPVHPQITSIDDVAGMVDVGQWTTTFYPDISNGMGKNIRQPAANLNGQVINPGQEFSFLGGVGPIDPAHGFAMGGVIKGGKSDHTGAMGGGICSASTTMFNAAANAGLQIDERHAHFYYINRYPVGRDATVYSDGATTWDVKWTNDTPYPIVIRAWATKGSKSTITIQLWSWPTNRTVTWSGGGMADIVKAVENPPEYTSSLPAGTTARAEFLTNGFKTSVTRIVTDASGKVIHDDTWGSSYAAVNGQLLIGGAPPKPQTPAPAPVPPTPAPAVIAAPDATSAGRPRRVG